MKRDRTQKRIATPAHRSRWSGAAALLLAGLLLDACAAGPSALDPKGPRANLISDFGWLMFAIAAAVFVLVVVLLIFAIYRSRRRQDEEPARSGFAMIAAGGIALPVVVLFAIVVLTVQAESTLSAPATSPTTVVEVIGHQWWWEVRYPALGIVTANEIHIPAGQQVELELTSADVIHSFWVPELMGKMDTIPGQTNSTWIEATQPGTYLGECAEYCGTEHAKMHFQVVADAPAAFAAWTQGQQQPAATPSNQTLVRGRQTFLGSACVYCHTLRGTAATGTVGPDLTHLASRQWIAAGTILNNRGNLAGWIIDPQSIKPGNLMPPTSLDSADLQDLIDYLESLK